MKKDKLEIIKEMYAVNDSNSAFLGTSSYRNMLDNIHKGRYVESESTKQGGTEENGKTYYDNISVDRMSFYEPYSFSVPDCEYSDNYEEF